MADLPFHYYLALRGDLIRENMAEANAIAAATRSDDDDDTDVIEFDAKAAKAGTMTGVTD